MALVKSGHDKILIQERQCELPISNEPKLAIYVERKSERIRRVKYPMFSIAKICAIIIFLCGEEHGATIGQIQDYLMKVHNRSTRQDELKRHLGRMVKNNLIAEIHYLRCRSTVYKVKENGKQLADTLHKLKEAEDPLFSLLSFGNHFT